LEEFMKPKFVDPRDVPFQSLLRYIQVRAALGLSPMAEESRAIFMRYLSSWIKGSDAEDHFRRQFAIRPKQEILLSKLDGAAKAGEYVSITAGLPSHSQKLDALLRLGPITFSRWGGGVGLIYLDGDGIFTKYVFEGGPALPIASHMPCYCNTVTREMRTIYIWEAFP
jgi:hypothetical protein